jgi:hypothetical protein
MANASLSYLISVPKRIRTRYVTSNYTLVDTDHYNWLQVTGNFNITLSNANAGLTEGLEVIIQNFGNDIVTLTLSPNVTLYSVGTKIPVQYRACHVMYLGGNFWTATGYLTN